MPYDVQATGGRPATAPPSGLLNVTAITRAKPSDWDGPFLMRELAAWYWVDGWITGRRASMPNMTRCTFFYDP